MYDFFSLSLPRLRKNRDSSPSSSAVYLFESFVVHGSWRGVREQNWNEPARHLTMSYFHLLHWHKLACTKTYMKSSPQKMISKKKKKTDQHLLWQNDKRERWLELVSVHFANSHVKWCNNRFLKCLWIIVQFFFPLLLPNLTPNTPDTTESRLVSVHTCTILTCYIFLGVDKFFFLCQTPLLSSPV